jgi:hypothetical protein
MQEQTTQVQTPEERDKEIEQLKHWLEHFARKFKFAASRKERCEELMRRRSAKKWDAAKTARMVRRLMAANQELEQSEGALDQCGARLRELGVEVDIVSRSGAEAAA